MKYFIAYLKARNGSREEENLFESFLVIAETKPLARVKFNKYLKDHNYPKEQQIENYDLLEMEPI